MLGFNKNKDNIKSLNFTLLLLENNAEIFKNRLFTKELLLFKENKNKKVFIKYTNYNYSLISKQSINTINLKTHYNNKYYTLINNSNITSENSNLETNNSNTLDSFITSNFIKKRLSILKLQYYCEYIASSNNT